MKIVNIWMFLNCIKRDQLRKLVELGYLLSYGDVMKSNNYSCATLEAPGHHIISLVVELSWPP